MNESASLHNLSRKSISNDVFLKLYKKETKAFLNYKTESSQNTSRVIENQMKINLTDRSQKNSCCSINKGSSILQIKEGTWNDYKSLLNDFKHKAVPEDTMNLNKCLRDTGILQDDPTSYEYKIKLRNRIFNKLTKRKGVAMGELENLTPSRQRNESKIKDISRPNIFERNEMWMKVRNSKIKVMKKENESTEMVECTFKPNRSIQCSRGLSENRPINDQKQIYENMYIRLLPQII